MARCTAPVRGHRTASAAANCPACGERYGGYRGYSGYGSYSPSSYSPSRNRGSGRSSGGSSRHDTAAMVADQVRLSCTRLPRCGRLHRSVRTSSKSDGARSS